MAIAIIPARGGSKRIPRKNIKDFHGKPIIAYSIEAAMQSNCFERVIVSTDDSEIAAVAKQYGAEVPFVRPKEISDDFATTLDVMSHAVLWCEKNFSKTNYYACIYATAPFIQFINLCDVEADFLKSNSDYLFAVTEYLFPIQRAIKLDSQGFCDMYDRKYLDVRSQDLAPAFHDAGQFYFGKPEAFKFKKPIFHTSKSKPYLLPSYLVQDIDSLDDWGRAEMMFEVLTRKVNG